MLKRILAMAASVLILSPGWSPEAGAQDARPLSVDIARQVDAIFASWAVTSHR